MNDDPNPLQLIDYESRIGQLLYYNIHKYKYVGEKNKEYDVIQGIFYELNQLPELSNRHIRWYTIIINLIRHCCDERNKETFHGLPIPQSMENDGFKMTSNVEKGKQTEIEIPPYINLIESYTTEVARLGTLVSTKEEINPGYLDYKHERINALLTELLIKMGPQINNEPWEDAFILTIGNASQNISRLKQNLPLKTTNSEEYKVLIGKRIENLSPKRRKELSNMDAFWNGFIT